MANTRRKIVVLQSANHLRSQGLSAGTIVDAQVSGNRATPMTPGKRAFHLTRGQWRFATAEEVSKVAAIDHHLAPKDDPATGDGSIVTGTEANPVDLPDTPPTDTTPVPDDPGPEGEQGEPANPVDSTGDPAPAPALDEEE